MVCVHLKSLKVQKSGVPHAQASGQFFLGYLPPGCNLFLSQVV